MKKVFYWLSLVLPLFDLVVGTVQGVKDGLKDIKNGRTVRAEKNAEAFKKANRGE